MRQQQHQTTDHFVLALRTPRTRLSMCCGGGGDSECHVGKLIGDSLLAPHFSLSLPLDNSISLYVSGNSIHSFTYTSSLIGRIYESNRNHNKKTQRQTARKPERKTVELCVSWAHMFSYFFIICINITGHIQKYTASAQLL